MSRQYIFMNCFCWCWIKYRSIETLYRSVKTKLQMHSLSRFPVRFSFFIKFLGNALPFTLIGRTICLKIPWEIRDESLDESSKNVIFRFSLSLLEATFRFIFQDCSAGIRAYPSLKDDSRPKLLVSCNLYRKLIDVLLASQNSQAWRHSEMWGAFSSSGDYKLAGHNW